MIRQLPQDVVDRIAAGEVVERPAAVIKELVENALDAGATAIQVEIEEGGLRLMRVADDGSGIAAEDLALTFASHATSKLTDVGDLEHIGSFGFRGEALSSVGAVSRCRLVTATADGDGGRRIDCEAGRIAGPHPAACARGTVVEVRDLFHNTPARRRFLQTPRTEASRCREVVAAMALANPGVRFSLRIDGRSRFDIGSGLDLGQRIDAIYGSELRADLVPVEAQDGVGRVMGFVSLPAAARPRPRMQLAYVNGRLVKDRSVPAAVRSAFRDFLPGALQPAFLIMLSLDPARVDVNVHPTKAEVRFRERDDVFRLIRRACRQALVGADLAPRVPLHGRAVESPTDAPISGGAASFAVAESLFRRNAPSANIPKSAPVSASSRAEPATVVSAPAPRVAQHFLQIFDTYLVHDGPDGLVIVDQHALHERILYSRLRDQWEGGRIEKQRLLVPELVRLDPEDLDRALAMADDLSALGLEVAAFGDDRVAVQAVPAVLRGERLDHLLRDMIHPPDVAIGAPHSLERRLFTMACHSAVKAGDPLDESEAGELLKQGLGLEHDATCPHGRPTRVVVGRAELERLFKRTGF